MIENLILYKPEEIFLCSATEHDHMRCEKQCAICKENLKNNFEKVIPKTNI